MRLADCNGGGSEWIKLNVGGSIFQTTRTTLSMDENSVLAKMFGDSGWRSATDSEGAYLLDRESKYFRPVLNFLRDGELIIDPDTSAEGVLREARFFNVQGIIDILEPNLTPPVKAPGGSWRDNNTEAELTRKDIILALVKTPTDGKLRLQGLHLPGLDLSRLDLSGVNLSKTNLAGANLSESSLEHANLERANLQGAIMIKCGLSAANLQEADLSGAQLANASLQGSNLQGANLSRANLCFGNLQFCNLQGANLSGANLQSANLTKASIKGANFTGVNRTGTNLTDGGLLI